MNPGAFAETGRCYYCNSLSCQCDREDVTPAAVFCAALCGGEWRDTKTGRIVSEETANDLIGDQKSALDWRDDYDGEG